MNGALRPARVLIAGGGIGGLSAAIALGRRGIPATVIERSSFADQTGAGIQLGPNATAVLRELGVLDRIKDRIFRPEALVIFDAVTGERLTSMPLGGAIEKAYGAPYLTLHRSDLHTGLIAACRKLWNVELLENTPATGVGGFDDRVVVTTDRRRSWEGSCLVAADGLWSEVRQRIAPGTSLRFAGATAWRALHLRLSIAAPFDAPIVGLWLGSRAHLVHYPVLGGAALNVVVIVESAEVHSDWTKEADPSPLMERVENWAKPVRELMAQASSWRCWSLYRLSSLRKWHDGRIILIGDAAHPVLPYLAQGAALAVEDAAALAASLARQRGDPQLAFREFENARRRRTADVQRLASLYGRAYHWRGPFAAVRNAILKRSSPQRLLERLAWLYTPRIPV
jgi:2-polyprenyl-6-methoxyphenol hydroxylase-like FAD-dependent oxidoreductase